MGKRVVAWLVALGVVGALGVGGVVVARSTGTREPPVLGLAPAGASGEQAGAAVAGSSQSAADDRARPPTAYRLPANLPDLPDEARAWSLRPGATADRVVTLARALGMAGQPKQTPDGWMLVDGNRYLHVSRSSGSSWSYGGRFDVPCTQVASVSGDTPVEGPGAVVGCVVPASPDADSSSAGAGASGSQGGGSAPPVAEPIQAQPDPSGEVRKPAIGGARVPCLRVPPCNGCRVPTACRWPAKPPRPANLPSKAEAERIARELFGRAGLDLRTATVRVVDGWWSWQVTASPQVDGRDTVGWSWTASIGPGGRVEYASGWLSTPEPGAIYPLLGVDKALEPLNQRRQAGVSERSFCPGDKAAWSGCVPWPASSRRLTGVRLGLQYAPIVAVGRQPVPAAAYLVPAYLFEFDDDPNSVEAVLAIQDRFVAATPPQPLPAPAATEPASVTP